MPAKHKCGHSKDNTRDYKDSRYGLYDCEGCCRQKAHQADRSNNAKIKEIDQELAKLSVVKNSTGWFWHRSLTFALQELIVAWSRECQETPAHHRARGLGQKGRAQSRVGRSMIATTVLPAARDLENPRRATHRLDDQKNKRLKQEDHCSSWVGAWNGK